MENFDLKKLKKLSKELKKHKLNTSGYNEAKNQLVKYCEQHQTHRYLARVTIPGKFNPDGSMVRKHVGEFRSLMCLGTNVENLNDSRNKKIVEVAVGSGGLYNIVAIIIELPKWNSQHGPEQRLLRHPWVHPTAEKAVIDAAYKALAKRYHPT